MRKQISQSVKIFHGSTEIVDAPQIRCVRGTLDFGVGFYTTLIEEQAEKWATVKQNRLMASGISAKAIVNIYDFFADDLKSISYKHFENPDSEWLDFVMKHRDEKAYSKNNSYGFEPNHKFHHKFDIVDGEVADDTIYDILTAYRAGLQTKDMLLEKLKYKKKNNQIAFCTEPAILLLNFVGSYERNQANEF